jgi:glycosyltransferase involved in cell wall biosynthesis
MSERARTVRLVVLSGGLEAARRAVDKIYPGASVEVVDKERLRAGRRAALLGELRERPVDRFVYFTYVDAWQLDRARMAAYALLSGASRAVFLDVEHARIEIGPGRLLFAEIPRTVVEHLLAPFVVAASLALSWALGAVARPRGRAPEANGTEPLDVLFVRPTPTIGVMEAGESAHMRGVLDGLRELGHRVRVLANDDMPAIRRAGHELAIERPGTLFNATPLAFELWQNLRFTGRLLREVRRKRPDLLYQRHGRNGWSGAAVSYLTGVPLFLEWNNSEIWATRYWSPFGGWAHIVAAFERASRRAAACVVVVSRALEREVARAGVEPTRILFNPNGVDPERFRPGAGGAAIRERLGLGDARGGPLVVGFVGSFNHYQGTELLMRAASELCRRVDARLLLVGYGETLAATRAAAEEEGISDRVVFTDRVPVDDVPAYVDASDVAVAPMRPNPDGSDFFNSPVKVFEYMAAGRAIVASRLGQIVDVIDDGETGLLVEPDDAHALAAAIERLAMDPALRERLGLAARRTAVERHTWRQNASRVVAAFKSLPVEKARG